MRLGSWITVPHPTIVEILARQDFEWICVDLEHSPVNRLELQTAVAIIQGHGKKAFARVALNSLHHIKFPLDAGVDGVIIPMVNSAAQAKDAIESCLYPPHGNRGAGLSRAQAFGLDFDGHLKKNFSDLEIIVQIEHIQAVEEIDEILALDRLNGVFIGPFDLSGSMGIPGQLDHPRLKEAIKKVASKTSESGKLLGAHVIKPDAKSVKDFKSRGFDFLAFSLDTLFLATKIKDELDQMKEGAK
jgi:2-keto-3-deoxy-L-rhamnonate aldolase RhmA